MWKHKVELRRRLSWMLWWVDLHSAKKAIPKEQGQLAASTAPWRGAHSIQPGIVTDSTTRKYAKSCQIYPNVLKSYLRRWTSKGTRPCPSDVRIFQKLRPDCQTKIRTQASRHNFQFRFKKAKQRQSKGKAKAKQRQSKEGLVPITESQAVESRCHVLTRPGYEAQLAVSQGNSANTIASISRMSDDVQRSNKKHRRHGKKKNKTWNIRNERNKKHVLKSQHAADCQINVFWVSWVL